MTAFTSGRINEPPRTVSVPWPLITVVKPSSSYTFPVLPRPVIFPIQASCLFEGAPPAPHNACPPNTEAARKPRPPKNPRRFHSSEPNLRIGYSPEH